MMHTANCTLHTAYCSQHTAHCILLTAHCTLHTAHFTLLSTLYYTMFKWHFYIMLLILQIAVIHFFCVVEPQHLNKVGLSINSDNSLNFPR